MKYKMVVLDLDGTLLDDNSNIPEQNKEVLKHLHEKGVSIVIATGRSYLFAKEGIENIGIPVTLISNNGNALWEPLEDKQLSAKYIDPETFYNVARKGRKFNLFPVLHVGHFNKGIDFITEYSPNFHAYGSYLRDRNDRNHVLDNLENYIDPKVMMMCYTGDLNVLHEFQNTITAKFSPNLYSHIVLTLESVGPLLEISHPEGTKWHMVEKCAKTMGIRPSEIISIGNDTNDITMLTHSGVGVAVANSTEDVKKTASLVSPYTNNQAGVAKALKELFSL